MKKVYDVIIEVEEGLAARLNDLMTIDCFEEEADKLDRLGFKEDETVYHGSVLKDGYNINVSVLTGQNNAWIEFYVLDSDGNCILSGEDNDGDVTCEYNLFNDDVDFNITVKAVS